MSSLVGALCGHRDVEELHPRRLDELVLDGEAILLQIDDRLYAERSKVGIVPAVGLRPAIVGLIDTPEVVDADRRRFRRGGGGG